MDDHTLRVALGYEAALVPGGGVTRYVQQLARRLSVHPEVSRLGLLAGSGFHEDGLADGPTAANTTAGDSFRDAPGLWIRQRLRGAAMRLPLGAKLVEDRYERRTAHLIPPGSFDIYHETNYVARPAPVPTVVSIHDLSIFDMPEHHPASRVRALTRLIPRSMTRAQGILTLSAFSARAIARRFPDAAHRISIAPAGIDPHFRPMSAEASGAARAAHGLAHRGFLLSVGSLEPRKNLAGVIDALMTLPEAVVRACPLVIAGGAGWENTPTRHKIARAQERGLVIPIGAVDESTLAALYAAARGMVFLSLYEGQGLPAQEAACSGTPVLTSRNSAMSDTLGAAALLADPNDVRDMAAGLLRLIDDDTLVPMAQARASGFQTEFSWETSVSATLVAYRAAMARFGKMDPCQS